MQNIDKAVDLKGLDMMSETEFNRSFLIQNTDHNLNRRYSERTRNMWRNLYRNGSTAYSIAKFFGASYNTVRAVVDEDYRFDLSVARSEYNRRYRDTHDIPYDPDYRQNLIDRKRKLINESLSHLVII